MSENDREDSHTDETESVTGYSGHPKPPDLVRLGSFKIEATIGTGGMGTVYRAYDESMKRAVALKVLHPSLEIAKKAKERFAREAWIAGQLEHPNVIKVYSRGEENRLHYIAMELADGGSLADHIKQLRDAIPAGSDVTDTVTKEYINSILKKFIDLANALEHIHSKGFIHRDIKPHNILISGPDKHFKFTDFGIAHAEDMTHITKAGDFIGTVRYMSPELLTAHRAIVDKRTDIYSLGVTLYEALTLNSPFEADSEEKFITEILSGHAIPARKRNRRLPRDLETVLMKATHQDPEKRYQSAAEFADDLLRVLDNRPIRAKRERTVARGYKHLKRNKKTFAVVLLTVLIVAFVSYWYYDARTSIMNRQRIIKTLQTAVTTRISPFDIDPDWNRLSKILYRHVVEGDLDSIMILFFKANSLYQYNYQEYSLFDNHKIGIAPLAIDLFSRDSSDTNNFAASLTDIEIAVDTSPWRRTAWFYQEYGTNRFTGIYIQLLTFHDSVDSVLGRTLIRIRLVSKHYLNVGVYQDYNRFRKLQEFYKDLLTMPQTPVLAVARDGDTLVYRGLGSKCGFEASSSFFNYFSYQILDVPELQPARPVYVDTAVDSFVTFIFDEYPLNFPRMAISHSENGHLSQTIAFSEVGLVKKFARYRVPYTTSFRGRFQDSLSVPIAGDFKVIEGVSGKIIISGQMRIKSARWKSVGMAGIAYNQPVPGIIDSVSQGLVRGFSCFTSSVTLPEMTFEEAVSLGKVDAVLKITPSINAARLFGDVYEFSGDTLTYDITFQAFDSSGTQ
jgi:serine/threonine protein kinase